MSAYSASAPVTASTTAPSATNATAGSRGQERHRVARATAPRRIVRVRHDLRSAERRARTTNHSTMTGPNSLPTACGAVALDANSPMRMAQRDRHDEMRERRRGDLEALDRRQHRDRRRDHAVAVEQRRRRTRRAATSHRDACAPRRLPRRTSAVSAMMPPSPSLSARMMNDDVLDRDDQRERPEDQRQRRRSTSAWRRLDRAVVEREDGPAARTAGWCRCRRRRRRARR